MTKVRRWTLTDFLFECVRPTLLEIDLWSPSAEKLLCMIAAHESGGFRHRRQLHGPALSLFQIEPMTFHDLTCRYLVRRSDLQARLMGFLPSEADRAFFTDPNPVPDLSDWLAQKQAQALLRALEVNDAFACAVSRVKLLAVPEPLPAVGDLDGLGAYAKAHWNGPGKATAEKYIQDFLCLPMDAWPLEWGDAL